MASEITPATKPDGYFAQGMPMSVSDLLDILTEKLVAPPLPGVLISVPGREARDDEH